MRKGMKIRLPIYLGLLVMLGVFRYYLRPKWAQERQEKLRAMEQGAERGGTATVPHVVRVDDNLSTLPPPIRAAAEEARATVETFRQRLADADAQAEAEGAARSGVYSLLVQLREGDEHERIWLQDVTWRDGAFHGRTESVPNVLRTIGARYPVKVKPGEIVDWVVKRDGAAMEGAYTARAWHQLQQPE